MTQYTEEQIKRLKSDMVGKKVTGFYYEKEEDYFVITFEGDAEISIRFMADLVA